MIRPNKSPGLIWIRTVWHSDGNPKKLIPDLCLLPYFEKKISRRQKYPVGIELTFTRLSLTRCTWEQKFHFELYELNVKLSKRYLQTWSIWATACDFQQYGILTWIDSDEPVHPLFKLRISKWCSVSSLIIIEYSSDKQRLWSDCAYAQAGLSLCWSHIPHCWQSHVATHFINHLDDTYKHVWKQITSIAHFGCLLFIPD